MTREERIRYLVSDDCHNIRIWIEQCEFEQLWDWVRSVVSYDNWDDESLAVEWAYRKDEAIELDDNDIVLMENA